MRIGLVLAAAIGIVTALSGALPEIAASPMMVASCVMLGIALRQPSAQRIRLL